MRRMTADISIRPATADDLAAIVAMLADDALGAARESPDDLEPYVTAYERLRRDPNQHLMVADRDGGVVGTLQLTIIPACPPGQHPLDHRGRTRARFGARTGPRRAADRLGGRRVPPPGLLPGPADLRPVRPDAHRFYERLGFTGSHLGFKLQL